METDIDSFCFELTCIQKQHLLDRQVDSVPAYYTRTQCSQSRPDVAWDNSTLSPCSLNAVWLFIPYPKAAPPTSLLLHSKQMHCHGFAREFEVVVWSVTMGPAVVRRSGFPGSAMKASLGWQAASKGVTVTGPRQASFRRASGAAVKCPQALLLPHD